MRFHHRSRKEAEHFVKFDKPIGALDPPPSLSFYPFHFSSPRLFSLLFLLCAGRRNPEIKYVEIASEINRERAGTVTMIISGHLREGVTELEVLTEVSGSFLISMLIFEKIARDIRINILLHTTSS